MDSWFDFPARFCSLPQERKVYGSAFGDKPHRKSPTPTRSEPSLPAAIPSLKHGLNQE